MHDLLLFALICLFFILVYYSSKPEKKTKPTQVDASPPWHPDPEVRKSVKLITLEDPPILPQLDSWGAIRNELQLLQDQTYMCDEEIELRLNHVDQARFELIRKEQVASEKISE